MFSVRHRSTRLQGASLEAISGQRERKTHLFLTQAPLRQLPVPAYRVLCEALWPISNGAPWVLIDQLLALLRNTATCQNDAKLQEQYVTRVMCAHVAMFTQKFNDLSVYK